MKPSPHIVHVATKVVSGNAMGAMGAEARILRRVCFLQAIMMRSNWIGD